jgi:arginase
MRVQILAVPYDSGIRGWRMGAGPERLLEAGLAGHLQADGFEVNAELLTVESDSARGEIQTVFRLLELLAERVRAAVTAGQFPLVLAGSCLTASGTLAGLAAGPKSVFWFDAHGDLNTPDTTITGFLDGMALAMALGRCWQRRTAAIPGFSPVTPDRTCLIGVRDLDPPEADLIKQSAIPHISPTAIGSLPGFLASRAQGGDAYVHCDLDVLDPAVGRVNPFPAPGGLSVSAFTTAVETIGRHARVRAAAITAYAPEYDPDGTVPPSAFAVARALVRGAAEAGRR